MLIDISISIYSLYFPITLHIPNSPIFLHEDLPEKRKSVFRLYLHIRCEGHDGKTEFYRLNYENVNFSV